MSWTRATTIVLATFVVSAVLIYLVTGFYAEATLHALRLTI